MIRLRQRFTTMLSQRSPYPVAIQALVSLVLAVAPLSALSMGGSFGLPTASWRFWVLCILVGLHLLILWVVPVRKLPIWAVICYLVAQCGLVIAAQAVLPALVLNYAYLVIVVQAITVTRPWIWVPLAIGIWLAWSGTLLIASAGAWGWLQSNLALAFPATCVIIAAVVYARQMRRHEQAQQLLTQVQQRYVSTTQAMREMQQRFALEERSRLAQTVADEVHMTLTRTEQSVAQAISQAQANLTRVQGTIAQTRDSAGLAIERLRSAIMVLRGDLDGPYQGPIGAATISLREEGVISSLSAKVLTWVLPLVFTALAALLTLLQHQFALDSLSPVVIFGTALLALSVCTQRIQNPFLLQVGFAGQAIAVTGMAVLTQTLPLLLGLLLVVWQIMTRLPPLHAVLLFAGLPVSLSLIVAQAMPASLSIENMVVFGTACLIVGGPLVLARRQLVRRRAAERQMAELSGEMERQTRGARALAVAAERARLAREFHDDLGSRLVLINLQLQLADDLAADDPRAALEELQKSRDQLHKAWQSVLATADAALTVEGATLAEGLQELVLQHRQFTSATIELLLDGDFMPLSPALACTAYRVAQEGLANACKHARPNRIALLVSADANLLTVTVSNDGATELETSQPPLAPAIIPRGSFGLAGLRERADLLGGGFEAGPLPGGGFRVRMVLPADEGE